MTHTYPEIATLQCTRGPMAGEKAHIPPFPLLLATASLCGLLIGCFELLIFVFVFPSLLYPRRSFVYIRNVYNAG